MTRCLLLFVSLLMAACDGADPVRTGDRSEGATRLGVVLGETADQSAFAKADVPRAFVFPTDHDQHPAFRSEWWYLTVALTDSTGREFGVQFTLFRQALRPPAPMVDQSLWSLDHAWLAHVAIVDVEHGEHRAWERLSRDHPALAGVTRDTGERGAQVLAHLDDWELRITADGLALDAFAEGWRADLHLKARLPVIPQGEAGLSRKSAGQASYYYSWPGLAAAGTVQTPSGEFTVTGLGWFDHEWSTSVLSPEQSGWDWLAVHLDDGRSLMVFRLRRLDGQRDPFDHGVLVDKTGTHRVLDADDFELSPESYWRDPDGIDWPVSWRVRLGAESLRFHATIPDQRMQLRIPYWEGLIRVDDVNGRRIGSGYLELTGY